MAGDYDCSRTFPSASTSVRQSGRRRGVSGNGWGTTFASILAMSPTGPALQTTAIPHEHFVQFYDQDEFLLDEVSGFVKAGLQAGHACLVIATPQHRKGL